MKKIGILMVLLFLLMQSGGALFFYQMKQCYARFQMQQLLAKDVTEFEKLILSISTYQQSIFEKDEIQVNGTMYDVKSIVFKDGNIELMVVNDFKETGIINQIKKIVGSKNQSNNQLPNQLLQLLSLVYIAPSNATSFFESVTTQKGFREIDKMVSSLQSDITVPPPKIV